MLYNIRGKFSKHFTSKISTNQHHLPLSNDSAESNEIHGYQPWLETWSCKCLGFHVTTSIPFKIPPRKNLVSCSWMEFGKCTHFKHVQNDAGISSQNVLSSVRNWKNMKITNIRKHRDHGFALLTAKELLLLYQFLKPKSSFNENRFENFKSTQ